MQLRSGEVVECYGKKKYTSYYGALRDSKGMNRHFDGNKSNPYHCSFCKFWHSGNTLNSKKKLNRHARRENQ